MFLIGMKATEVLKVKDGVARLAEDTLTNSYSIGLKTDKDMEWKYISKELQLILEKIAKRTDVKERIHAHKFRNYSTICKTKSGEFKK